MRPFAVRRAVRPLQRCVSPLLALACLAGGASHAAAQQLRWDGNFELVTSRQPYLDLPAPPEPANATSRISRHAVSRDGRYVVFDSDATNLGGVWIPNLYLRDRRQAWVTPLAESGRNAAISGDGNHVAFEVCQSVCQVWARDLRTQAPATMLSTAANGAWDPSRESTGPVLSNNGRFLVFVSRSPFVTGDGSGRRHVVLRDRDADADGVFDEPGGVSVQTITMVGGVMANADSETPEVSDDGRYVAFRSLASNLVAGDSFNTWDVFLRDRQQVQPKRLNQRPGNQPSPTQIVEAHLSMTPDGRYVAFSSADGLLVSGTPIDTNNAADVYVYDRLAMTLSRVDMSTAQVSAGASGLATISADGRYVAMQSVSTFGWPVQAFVTDRNSATPSTRTKRVSTAPSGAPPQLASTAPQISADGTLVLFWSAETSFLDIAPPVAPQLYAASYLLINPVNRVLPPASGSATFTVTAHPHAFWRPTWDQASWVAPFGETYGIGSGSFTMQVPEANPTTARRSAGIKVGSSTATLTQNGELTLQSLWPSSGSMSGYTEVHLSGTGFEPSMTAYFGTIQIQGTLFHDEGSISLWVPPSSVAGPVDVRLVAPDGRTVTLSGGFEFLDRTPPSSSAGMGGPHGNQPWFNGDVNLTFSFEDYETPITAVSCGTISGMTATGSLVVTEDTNGGWFSCSATSAGGTTTPGFNVYRDTTPPVVTFTSPQPGQVVEPGTALSGEFTCTDATSGVARCGQSTPSGVALETSTPGRHVFGVGAEDVAGNAGWGGVEYAVETDVCLAPPQGLKAWLRFDGDVLDATGGSVVANSQMPPDGYVAGLSGQAYRFLPRDIGYLEVQHGSRLTFESAMTVALWVKPSIDKSALLISSAQFSLWRLVDGRISWSVNGNEGYGGGSYSMVTAPLDEWTHVALVVDAGVGRLFINGQLVNTMPLSITRLADVPPSTPLLIGDGLYSWNTNEFVGALDDVAFFDRALSQPEIAATFAARESSYCYRTWTPTITVPDVTIRYGEVAYEAVATLHSHRGTPLAGKTLVLTDPASGNTATLTTDADGTVRWVVLSDRAAGTYASGLTASFPGDAVYAAATASATVTVGHGDPRVTWAIPASITYGTPLSSVQLNATAAVAGTFSYYPAAGVVLPAGSHVLTTTFTPTSANYAQWTVSLGFIVAKAPPQLTLHAGTFEFDGQPHGATASASDYRGWTLSPPVTLTYDGSSAAPTAVGVYTVVGSFAGDANHEPASATATLTISRRTPMITFSTPLNFSYDGLPHGVTATVTGIGGVVLGTAAVTYDGSPDAPVDGGTYTVSATFDGNATYAARTFSTTLTILKVTPAVVFSPLPLTRAYDGQPHAVTATIKGIGGTVVATVSPTYNAGGTPPVDAGSYTVAIAWPGDRNYNSCNVSTTLTITRATPTITFDPSSATVAYDGRPQVVTATVGGAGGADLGVVPVTYNGSGAAPVAPGTYTVAATFSGNGNYMSRAASTTLTIARATPVVTVSGGPFTFDGQPHAASVTISGVTGEVPPGAVTITYNGSATVPVGAGTYAVTASVAGAGNYDAASGSGTLTIEKGQPALAVTGSSAIYDGQAHAVVVSATGVNGATLSPVTVTYDGTSSIPVNAGTYAVHASFAGDVNHLPASASATLVIAKASPALSWNQPAPLAYGIPLGAGQLNATANAPGAFAYAPAAGTVLGVGTGHVLTATFTPTDAQNFQSGGTVSIAITVERAAAAVSVGGGAFTYDGQPHAATASAVGVGGVSLTPVSLTYNGSAVVPVDAGTYHVVGTFAGDANHAPTSASGTLTIVPAAPALSWSAPASLVYGTPLGGAQLNATASVAGTITYAPGPGAVLAGGTHTLTATFAPADPQNYASATVSATLIVERATPSLSVIGGAFTYDGQPHAASTSGSGIDGTTLTPIATTYNGSAAAPVSVGTYDVVATFAGDANHAPATATATITIDRASAVLSWNAPAAITYGTRLDAAQLNATASVSGSFSYSPAAGTRLGGGTHALTATFTPADAQNYETAVLTTTIVVQRKVPNLGLQFASVTYDGQPHAADAAAVGVDWEPLEPLTVTYNGSTTVPVDAGIYDITSSFAGNDNYAPRSVTTTGEIRRAPVPSMSWQGNGWLVYGTPLGADHLQATASVPGTFSYAPGAGTIPPAGARTVTATFTPASPNYVGGGSLTRTFTVYPRGLTAVANNAVKVYGTSLPAFTAALDGFVNGDTPASLGGALAFATAATASSPVGSYSVTPAGLSSPNYTIMFVSGTLSIVKAPVTVALAASPTPSGLDMPITLTATMAAALGAPTAPSGTVRFFDGATLLGSATLSGDTATLLTGGLAAGSHTIEARYDGDASFDVGSRTATHVVNTAAATPAIALTTSRQPASTSQSMTFTATITVATAGTIAFYDGETLLGSGSIASGRATLTVASLAAGSHAITARFQGNASAPPVISPVLVQSVTAGGWKDRTSTLSLVSSANPSALGGSVTFTATASGSSGTPTGRILFMIDGLVVGDPAGIAMSSGQAAVTMSTFTGGRHKVTATYLGNSNYRGSTGALTQTVN